MGSKSRATLAAPVGRRLRRGNRWRTCRLEYRPAVPPGQVFGDALCVAALPPCNRTVIDTDCLPIIPAHRECRLENPARRIDIEADVVTQPPAHLGWRAVDHGRDTRRPPAVDLQWSQIVRAIAVADRRADPAAFLVAQAPECSSKLGATIGRAFDAGLHLPLLRRKHSAPRLGLNRLGKQHDDTDGGANGSGLSHR